MKKNCPLFFMASPCFEEKVKTKLCFLLSTNDFRDIRPSITISKLISIVLLLLTSISIHATSSATVGFAANSNDLVGAELFYNQLESGYVKVVLNKYYLCTSQKFKEVEQVAIHDKAHVQLIKRLDLVKESSDKITLEETSDCINEEEACYFKVSYSAETYLTLSEDGFDVTWGSTIVKGTFANLEMTTKQGICLLVHITNPWTDKSNNAPQLNEFPFPLICENQETTINLSGIDSDGDDTEITIVDPYSHEVKEVHEYYYDLEHKRFGPNLNLLGEDESFLTERPPFHNIKYSDCHNSLNPLCTSEFSYDEISKELKLTGMPGKYLLGLSLKDIKNKKKNSEHSMFLIITII